jgi:hypothetical protein
MKVDGACDFSDVSFGWCKPGSPLYTVENNGPHGVRSENRPSTLLCSSYYDTQQPFAPEGVGSLEMVVMNDEIRRLSCSSPRAEPGQPV